METMGKAAMVVGVILILLGLFYAVAPHSIHTSSGLGFGWEHTMHMILGGILIVVGLVLAVMGRKKGQKPAAAAPAQQAAQA